MEIETKGTVYNKTNQTLAYADNNSNSREINRWTEGNNEEINESSTGHGIYN